MIASCDNCSSPGQCCKGFVLSKGGECFTVWKDVDWKAQASEWVKENSLPFVPTDIIRHEQETSDGRKYFVPVFACPLLDASGRCSDYINRPDLCKSYQVGEDAMCCFYQPPSEDGTLLEKEKL